MLRLGFRVFEHKTEKVVRGLRNWYN